VWELPGDGSTFGAVLWQASGRDPDAMLKFEVARQSRSPGLFGPVQAVPWADKGQQELSRLASSPWELSGEVCAFSGGLQQVSGRDPDAIFGL